jgi:hypothetical protein
LLFDGVAFRAEPLRQGEAAARLPRLLCLRRQRERGGCHEQDIRKSHLHLPSFAYEQITEDGVVVDLNQRSHLEGVEDIPTVRSVVSKLR